MVESGQSEIRHVSFASQLHAQLPVEALDYAALMQRLGAEFFARPDRPSFDHLIVVHEGSGTHVIDFEPVALFPGRMIRIRPGQVEAWDAHADVHASVVLSALPSASTTTQSGGRSFVDPGSRSMEIAASLVELVRVEQARFDTAESSSRLLAHLYGALDALFDRALPPGSTSTLPAPYVEFRSAIETELTEHHQVRYYATRLGYSERTLSRACQRVTGLTAKQVLSERIALEAKRLLAHTELPAAIVGLQLGFTEATNFAKFFARETGERPADFRRTLRAGGASDRTGPAHA